MNPTTQPAQRPTPLTDYTWAMAKDRFLPLAGTPAKAQHWFRVAEAMRDISQRVEIERGGLERRNAELADALAAAEKRAAVWMSLVYGLPDEIMEKYNAALKAFEQKQALAQPATTHE